MAFGNGNAFDPNTTVYSFNLKDKDLPAPHFTTQRKDGETYTDLPPVSRISGNLIGARVRKNTHQGKVIATVTATIKDNADVYFVSIPFTYLGRNIMNSLCGLSSFDGIELSVYKGKPKKEGQEGFSSSALWQNKALVFGKYKYEQLPVINKVMVGNQKVSDCVAIDTFFENEITELEKRIKSAPAKTADKVEQPKQEAPAGSGDTDPSDPPF